MSGPTPDEAYEKIWKPILEDENGLNQTNLKSILFDYGALLADISELYSYITEDQIRDPQTPVGDVIDLADKIVANEIDLGIQQVLGYLLNVLGTLADKPAKEKLKGLVNEINTLYEIGTTND